MRLEDYLEISISVERHYTGSTTVFYHDEYGRTLCFERDHRLHAYCGFDPPAPDEQEINHWECGNWHVGKEQRAEEFERCAAGLEYLNLVFQRTLYDRRRSTLDLALLRGLYRLITRYVGRLVLCCGTLSSWAD